MIATLNNPLDIAREGERLYDERHRARLEAQSPGQFAAVNVHTGDVHVAVEAIEALALARQAAPDGLFHLVLIGEDGAFRVSHASNARGGWLYR